MDAKRVVTLELLKDPEHHPPTHDCNMFFADHADLKTQVEAASLDSDDEKNTLINNWCEEN